MIPTSVWTFTRRKGETVCAPPRPLRIANSGFNGTRMGMVSMRVIFKQERSPLCEFVDERRDLLHDAIEKSLSLFRAGEVRMPNRAGLRDFVKFIYKINRTPVLHVCFAIRIG